MPITDTDRRHLTRAVDLAEEAVAAGDQAFGSLLVSPVGEVLFEDRNRVSTGDATRHPEIAAARWAAEHVDPAQRPRCVVYTSGEHCAMCAAAHAWVGLGRIVYATSGRQFARWAAELGMPAAPVAPLPITTVAPGVPTDGPDPELADRVRALHARSVGARG